MDKAEILSKFEKNFSKSLLQKQSFGKGGSACLWIEARALPEIAQYFCDEKKGDFDWLENLSVMQIENTLVVTYFIRSTQLEEALLLRCSVDLPSAQEQVDLPSVAQVWPMARPFEEEASELFGICFKNTNQETTTRAFNRLPEGWRGYPLRKGYIFPTEYLKISHSRPHHRGGAHD